MKAILFDLDNTLTDRNATIDRYAPVFMDAFCDSLRPDLTPMQISRVFQEADDGGYRGHEHRSELLRACDLWTAPVEASLLSAHWKGWIPENPEPMAGLDELLEWLASQPLKLGMITNGSSVAQRGKVRKLKLDERLQAIVVSEEVGCKKPDPRIFALAAQQLRLAAEDCIFVGDHPANDYSGARQAGMTAVWFEGFRPWVHAEEPKLKISSLHELPEVIGRLLPGEAPRR